MGHGLLQRRDPIRRKSLQDGTMIDSLFSAYKKIMKESGFWGVNPSIKNNTSALKRKFPIAQ